MGNSEAASNIERLQARMTANDAYRADAQKSIDDIMAAKELANRSGAIAALLSTGRAEDVQIVVDTATPAIVEF